MRRRKPGYRNDTDRCLLQVRDPATRLATVRYNGDTRLCEPRENRDGPHGGRRAAEGGAPLQEISAGGVRREEQAERSGRQGAESAVTELLLPPVSGVLLSGGQSARMGRDKAGLTWRGRSFARWVLDALHDVSDDVLAVRRPGQMALEAAGRTVFDRHSDVGPLAGLEAGLLAMHWEWAVVCPVDAPSVKTELLRLLVRLTDGGGPSLQAIVPVQDGRIHPLTACYRRSAAEVFAGAIRDGRLRVSSAVGQLEAIYVPEEVWRTADPDASSFVMVNTPEEYLRLCSADETRGIRNG